MNKNSFFFVLAILLHFTAVAQNISDVRDSILRSISEEKIEKINCKVTVLNVFDFINTVSVKLWNKDSLVFIMHSPSDYDRENLKLTDERIKKYNDRVKRYFGLNDSDQKKLNKYLTGTRLKKSAIEFKNNGYIYDGKFFIAEPHKIRLSSDPATALTNNIDNAFYYKVGNYYYLFIIYYNYLSTGSGADFGVAYLYIFEKRKFISNYVFPIDLSLTNSISFYGNDNNPGFLLLDNNAFNDDDYNVICSKYSVYQIKKTNVYRSLFSATGSDTLKICIDHLGKIIFTNINH
ncbi:MAG: hypothetical protein ACTHL3_07625 [Candidatus Nitrosocosmicus sp.]